MVLHVLRALFILLMAAVGWFFLNDPHRALGDMQWLMLMVSVAVGVLFICIDILAPRKKLAVFSGTFLGLLVGSFVSYALSFVIQMLVDQLLSGPNRLTAQQRISLLQFLDLAVGIVCVYLSISFVLQTKDDFRFIIPYVEFSKQTKGARPILLDTSVLIDGRISDIADTGILESQLIVPRFVLEELQAVADSGDKLKRNRGRRGLDVLQKLQGSRRVEVILYDSSVREQEGVAEMDVDQRLLQLAKELNARVLTNDFNLNKVAQLRGVDVININDLANALKPVVLPGEKLTVRLVKKGEQHGQGVGFLEDGTMVVVEQGRDYLEEEVEVVVKNAFQTSAGRMIFGHLADASRKPQHRHREGGRDANRETPREPAPPPAAPASQA